MGKNTEDKHSFFRHLWVQDLFIKGCHRWIEKGNPKVLGDDTPPFRGISAPFNHSAVWDGLFFLWGVSGLFLWVWRFIYPSFMDIWAYAGEYILRRHISRGNALFRLLYIRAVSYQGIQYPFVFRGDSCVGISFIGILPDAGNFSHSLYADICTGFVFDA